ncbi:MAG: matrixin family metalloprotease [Myxococcota bacterium]
MHSRSRLALATLATTSLLGLAADTASAYVFYKAQDSDAPLRWFRRNLEFRLSTTEPDDFPAADLLGLAEQSFDAWINTACGKVPDVVYMGTSDAQQGTAPGKLSDPPDNVIVFIHSQAKWVAAKADGGLGNSPTWIAITKIAHNTKTGEIVDADIEINDGGFKFSTDGTPGADEVDFQSMLTHEVGHYFGLDHSLDPTATMFASYSRTADGATQARTLAPDDEAGICELYTDVPLSSFESGDDGDSGNGCAGGGADGGLAALGLLGVIGLGRRRAAGVNA